MGLGGGGIDLGVGGGGMAACGAAASETMVDVVVDTGSEQGWRVLICH